MTASPSCAWTIFVRCSMSCSVCAYQGKTWQVWSSYFFQSFVLAESRRHEILREKFVRIDIGSAAAFPSLGGPSVPCLHIVSKSEMRFENEYTNLPKLHLFLSFCFFNFSTGKARRGKLGSKPPSRCGMARISWISHRESPVCVFFPFLSSEAFEPSQSSGVQRPQRFLLLPRSLKSHHWSHLFWVPFSVFGLVTWPFWPVMWKEIARVTEISVWGPVPKDLAVQDIDHCPKLFQCSISLFFFLVVDLNLYVSLCLWSIFRASSRFGSSCCRISSFDFPGDEGDQARKNRSREFLPKACWPNGPRPWQVQMWASCLDQLVQPQLGSLPFGFQTTQVEKINTTRDVWMCQSRYAMFQSTCIAVNHGSMRGKNSNVKGRGSPVQKHAMALLLNCYVAVALLGKTICTKMLRWWVWGALGSTATTTTNWCRCAKLRRICLQRSLVDTLLYWMPINIHYLVFVSFAGFKQKGSSQEIVIGK